MPLQEIRYQGKRKLNTFSEPTSGRSDWLCDASIKLALLLELTASLPIKILIPGIGHSTLAKILIDKGYDVRVCDLDESQVSKSNRSLNPSFFDLQGPVPKEFVGAFDCVVDSSVTDVFMQLTRGATPNTDTATKVYKNLLSMLRPGGVIVTFSMNNQPWKSIHSKLDLYSMHMVIRPKVTLTTARGRTTAKIGEDVLVLVASAKPLNLTLPDIKSNAAEITGWIEYLPVDWRSQRS